MHNYSSRGAGHTMGRKTTQAARMHECTPLSASACQQQPLRLDLQQDNDDYKDSKRPGHFTASEHKAQPNLHLCFNKMPKLAKTLRDGCTWCKP